MGIKRHKDYDKEVARLKETLRYLQHVMVTFGQNRERFKAEIKEAYYHMDPMDSSHSYQTIMMNSALLDNLEDNFDQLLRATKKPYFARIDVRQADKSQDEALYIGKVSLFDVDMETPLVVDWRAPIASLYYDGRLGESAYTVEGKSVTVDLKLKRQYTIEEAVLKDFVDVDISTSDTFLQAALGAHAGDKLKDIVSTIQGEQNAIIRSDIHKPLVVQGVAGSGKTTIALHRIAYLIYTYADTFKPEHFMILAPNSLFLDYISQVLPELGAQNALQTTYESYMLSLLGKQYKVASTTDKLLRLIETQADLKSRPETEVMRCSIAYKNTMAMKTIIETYVKHLAVKMMPKSDFKLHDQVLLSKKVLHQLFFEQYAYLPLYSRVEKIKQVMAKVLKEKRKVILERAESVYDQKIYSIRLKEPESEERRLKVVALIDERDRCLKSIENEAKTAVKRFFSATGKKQLLDYYGELFCDGDRLAHYGGFEVSEAVYRYIAEETKRNIGKNQLGLDDLAPLVYLKKFLFGFDEQTPIHYVVIDEAQDFGLFQFFVLRDILGTDRFTILGDLSQGIHKYRAIDDWSVIRQGIFKQEAVYLTLEQSYRTTVEIMNLANEVLAQRVAKSVPLARPVVRRGEAPIIKSYNKMRDLVLGIHQHISHLKEEGYTTVAVIGKTPKEAILLHQLLKTQHKMSATLMDERVSHYDHDLVIIPAYLAKGLEFDAVIVYTLQEVYTKDDLDIMLLYVAMTRPLHRLALFTMEGSLKALVDKG